MKINIVHPKIKKVHDKKKHVRIKSNMCPFCIPVQVLIINVLRIWGWGIVVSCLFLLMTRILAGEGKLYAGD